jgi:hypothetical protein
LILELERIERDAWEDVARAAPPPFAQGIGLEARPLGAAFLFLAARIPQYQFNWLGGTGLNGDDGSSIAAAVKRFREAGQEKFIVQIPPAPNAAHMEALARAEGLSSHPLAWAKFHRETSTAPRIETAFSIREVGPEAKDDFAQTAIAGFGMPATMAMWLSQIVGRPGWHAYVSYDGDAPAGTGALYVKGDFAWCGIGATRPEMRKRGGQSALLARRVADAAKYGAKHVATETGVPQEGQPAPSYKNILASGFDVAYVRPNWTLG